MSENIEFAAEKVQLFIEECGTMAEKNWCPAQVEMLHRLFLAVILGEEYSSELVDKRMNLWEELKHETV